MEKSKYNGVVRSIQTTVKKHSPEILTGIGIAGMITTVIFAVRATPKALEMIKKKEAELNQDLGVLDTLKTAWTCYIPSAMIGTASIVFLIGANSKNLKRNAALATAYTLSSSAFKEYQEKVEETIGEKKEQTVKDSIAKSKLEKDPISNKEIIITSKGDTLCYDAISGRYFKSDIEKIKKSVNELNRRMLDEMFISLNDFYYEIGLRGTELGDMLGWNIDKGYIELDFSSQLTDDGTPCLVLRYSLTPQYDFWN